MSKAKGQQMFGIKIHFEVKITQFENRNDVRTFGLVKLVKGLTKTKSAYNLLCLFRNTRMKASIFCSDH